MAKKPESNFDALLRQAKAKAASTKSKSPAPHPDLDHHLRGVGAGIVDTQAEIQRDWEKCFAQPFPGWSKDALSGVASFAGLPADAVEKLSPFTIYQAALVKKPSDLLEFKEIVTLSGVSKKRVQNVVIEWRKAGHRIEFPCSYKLLRPLLLKQWPGRRSVLSGPFAVVRYFLDQHRTDPQGV
jgi:hypothetical protein